MKIFEIFVVDCSQNQKNKLTERYLTHILQGVAPKKPKEGSVHKLLMLLAVPNIQELHFNLKVLLAELGLDSLDFVITSDIKIGK